MENIFEAGVRCPLFSSLEELAEETAFFEEREKKKAERQSQMDRHRSEHETAVTCRKCNKANVRFTYRQTRSADEPMSCVYKCSNPECGFSWFER